MITVTTNPALFLGAPGAGSGHVQRLDWERDVSALPQRDPFSV